MNTEKRNAFLKERLQKNITVSLSTGENVSGTLLDFDDVCIIFKVHKGQNCYTSYDGKNILIERGSCIMIY